VDDSVGRGNERKKKRREGFFVVLERGNREMDGFATTNNDEKLMQSPCRNQGTRQVRKKDRFPE